MKLEEVTTVVLDGMHILCGSGCTRAVEFAALIAGCVILGFALVIMPGIRMRILLVMLHCGVVAVPSMSASARLFRKPDQRDVLRDDQQGCVPIARDADHVNAWTNETAAFCSSRVWPVLAAPLGVDVAEPLSGGNRGGRWMVFCAGTAECFDKHDLPVMPPNTPVGKIIARCRGSCWCRTA